MKITKKFLHFSILGQIIQDQTIQICLSICHDDNKRINDDNDDDAGKVEVCIMMTMMIMIIRGFLSGGRGAFASAITKKAIEFDKKYVLEV